MASKKYTVDDLITAVESSISIRQVLIKLNLVPVGGNYKTIKKLINEFGLDTSHFLGRGWCKNKPSTNKRPMDDYLTNKQYIQSNKLRQKLLQYGYFEHKCYKCNLSMWMGKPIPLELEHKDGNNDNNSLDNLTILCPNCHAQTSTYRGKNKKRNRI